MDAQRTSPREATCPYQRAYSASSNWLLISRHQRSQGRFVFAVTDQQVGNWRRYSIFTPMMLWR